MLPHSHTQNLPLPFWPEPIRTASAFRFSRKQPDTSRVLWGYVRLTAGRRQHSGSGTAEGFFFFLFFASATLSRI